jgi:hypothetical protein
MALVSTSVVDWCRARSQRDGRCLGAALHHRGGPGPAVVGIVVQIHGEGLGQKARARPRRRVLGCACSDGRGQWANGGGGALFLFVEQVIEPGGRPQAGCRYFGWLARGRFRLNGYRLRWRRLDGGCLDPDRFDVGCLDPDRFDGGWFDPYRARIDGGRLWLDDEGLGFGLAEKLWFGRWSWFWVRFPLGFECCLWLGCWSWFWVWLPLPFGFECCLRVERNRHRLRFADHFFCLDRNRVRSEREHDLYPHRVRGDR